MQTTAVLQPLSTANLAALAKGSFIYLFIFSPKQTILGVNSLKLNMPVFIQDNVIQVYEWGKGNFHV